MCSMDPRRLELLLELSRLGSMHEVADALQVTTSTVSQQIAALAREVGTPLVEPDAEPAGEVRVAAFATAIRSSLLPVVRSLESGRFAVRLRIHEHEPSEA